MDAMDLDMRAPASSPVPTCVFDKLPPEILLQFVGYLSLEELYQLVKASPRSKSLRKLNDLTFGSKNFAPWRRRWAMFTVAYSAALTEAQDSAWEAQFNEPSASEPPPVASSIVSSAQVHRDGTVQKGDSEKRLEEVMQNTFVYYGFVPPDVAAASHEILSSPSGGSRGPKRYTLAGEALRFPIITERMIFDAIKGLFDEPPTGERSYLCLKRLGCEAGLLGKELEAVTAAPIDLVRSIVRNRSIESGQENLRCYMLITAYLLFTSLEPSQLRRVIVRATPAEMVDMFTDDRQKALTEYFSFLGLWMDLWEAQVGFLRFPEGYQEPPSAFPSQNRRVLCASLKMATRDMFAPTKPTMSEESTSTGSPSPQPLATASTSMANKGGLPPSQRSHSLNMDLLSQPTPGRRGFQRSISMGSDSFGPQPCVGAAETPAYTLTVEQRRVVETDLNPGELMKIRAYAGTGKTRCLVEYAKLRPQKKFLYIAFNKSAEMDAKSKFGPNVLCKTVHALALGVLGSVAPHVHAAKEDKTMPIPAFWGNKELVQELKLDEEQVIRDALLNPAAHFKPGRRNKKNPGQFESAEPGYEHTQNQKKPFPTATTVANVVKRTLEQFWNSVERDVLDNCLPHLMIRKLGLKSSMVLWWAKNIWRKIRHAVAPWLPHDAYLKLMHLSGVETGGDERAFGGYDAILFDEAQDANPSMATTILRQQARGIALIVVGDPYQRIYGFRGAGNEAFDDVQFPPTTTHYLTWSFRFGDGIASVANILLNALGEKVPVNGVRRSDSVGSVGRSIQHLAVPEKPFTVIFRRNVSLIKYAMELGLQCPNHKLYLKIQRNFHKKTLFNNLREAFALLHEGRIASTYPLKSWKTWADLKTHVEAEQEDGGSPDSPILSMVVQLEGAIMDPSFPSLLQLVESNVLDESEMHLADVILITAHQAKGLEWDRVHVFADFKPDYSVRNRLRKIKHWREEACILYVALTRARKELLIQHPLRQWIAGDRGWQKTYLQQIPETCHFFETDEDVSQPEMQRAHRLSHIIISTYSLIPPGSFTAIGDSWAHGNPGLLHGLLGYQPNAAHRETISLYRASAMATVGGFLETENYVRALTLRISEGGEEKGDEVVVWCERSPWVEVWSAWAGAERERVELWTEGVWERWLPGELG